MKEPFDIAIIGGGACGALLAVQLSMRADKPLHIALFDASGAFARGVAYSTPDPTHLLNVRADRMGAFPDRPDGFYRWLLAHEQEWRAAHPAFASLAVTPGSFMPRQLYGDYIASLLAEAERSNPQVSILRETAEVTDASFSPGGVTLTLANGRQCRTRRLALTIGNLPIRRLDNEEALIDSGRYAGPIWEAPAGSIFTRDAFAASDAPVLIIGTGLTMIDALLSLRHKGYTGKVIAASGNAQLPQPHIPNTPAYPRFLPPSSAPRTALALAGAIRREVAQAIRQGKDWRGVIDSLRADTPLLWTGLPESERRKLIRLLPFWNTHRHRMPPESASMLEKEIRQGTLNILKGRIAHITPEPDRLRVEITGRKDPLFVAHVLNCSGPENNILRSRNLLLDALLKKGAIQPGPLSMGIAADDRYHALGNAEDRLFVIGPQLIGGRFETVAMPELRQQAQELAGNLLALL